MRVSCAHGLPDARRATRSRGRAVGAGDWLRHAGGDREDNDGDVLAGAARLARRAALVRRKAPPNRHTLRVHKASALERLPILPPRGLPRHSDEYADPSCHWNE
eukprot:3859614-Pleurochrysis_carterae.AAC.2